MNENTLARQPLVQTQQRLHQRATNAELALKLQRDTTRPQIQDDGHARITVRLPSAMHAEIAQAAALATHSTNAEVVARLRAFGITDLRDRFALAVLTSLLPLHSQEFLYGDEADLACRARGCWAIADAMLKARQS